MGKNDASTTASYHVDGWMRPSYSLLECVTALMHAVDAASGHNMFPSSLLSKWFRQSNLYAIVETNCLPVDIEMETTDRN